MRILTVNVGSTSIKLRIVGKGDPASVDLPGPSHLAAGQLDATLLGLGTVDAVGHRVVHGGSEFRTPVVVDDDILSRLRGLADLAPLHQPPALDILDAVRTLLPDLPMVACFDTAFHATMPAEASTYAVPQRWRDLGARRYGFHGLSHAWASRRATQLATLAADARIVTCHLGGGASLAAVAGGRSVDTNMGFPPLHELVMAPPSGSVDPGLILWLQQHQGMAIGDIASDLEHGSGILALCGTDDMRQVTERAARGDQVAIDALGVYQHRLRAGIAAMVAALQGIDCLVFTGGVGEHSAPIRQAACSGLGFLGIAIDDQANATTVADQRISSPKSPVPVFVVESREDLEIARGVREALRIQSLTEEGEERDPSVAAAGGRDQHEGQPRVG
jgi:acetate kinase